MTKIQTWAFGGIAAIALAVGALLATGAVSSAQTATDTATPAATAAATADARRDRLFGRYDGDSGPDGLVWRYDHAA